ncbi:SDR family NAD(P)-dependent oxidoreductase [Dactylosporangium matsuzakiense]|uniref:Beta-ketoacyl-ACP reductase n=1 Tax=Dactylosporangium matsuzakiense TaxID=53360 RepID=A0A9W6KV31_9ACTN|nr:SDR family oxidoreductase [Dactylosporangium matsuzakiense]UWZ41790.1 SDR family oxidoreductase [Dactylosporangium matsuzakiense]GLL06965.1 beta-ketoacyl-ACP reductase [Dactylosporangium matsuzakiense]
MDLGLQGRRVFVTGASGHIGRAVAVAFAAEGARVAVGYHRDEAGAKAVAADAERAGGDAVAVRVDLADEPSVAAAVAAVHDAFGGVDVLVNNAVAWPPFPAPGERFETAPAQRMRDSLAANLLGPYLLSQAVAGGMRARGWGRIVHVSTGLVVDGRPGSAPYTTPKSGLHGLARTMSRELAADGVLTNVVMAGFVPGERQFPDEALRAAASAAATGRVSTADEIARVVVFLCSAANGNVTGELVRADGHFLTPA